MSDEGESPTDPTAPYEFPPPPPPPKNDVLHEPYRVFRSTLDTNLSIGETYRAYYVIGEQRGRAITNATFDAWKTVYPSSEQVTAIPDGFHEGVAADIERRLSRYFATDPLATRMMPQMDSSFIMAMRAVNGMLPKSREATIFAGVVLAWTAFETMCGDAWIAILNKYPRPFAEQLIKRKFTLDDSKERDEFFEKLVAALHKHNFDLRHVMGDHFEASFNFTRLAGIQRAYDMIFGPKTVAVLKAPYPVSLDSVEALRNALVHQAGRADRIFLKRVKDVELYSGLQLKQSVYDVPIDLNPIADSLMMAGFALIAHLDTILPNSATND